MILIRLFVLFFAVLLAGCQATPNDARNKLPAFSGESNKSIQTLSNCIHNGWSATRVVIKDDTTHTETTSNKTTVYTWEDSIFTDIYPKGNNSEVKFYKTFNMNDRVLNNRESIVKNCL